MAWKVMDAGKLMRIYGGAKTEMENNELREEENVHGKNEKTAHVKDEVIPRVKYEQEIKDIVKSLSYSTSKRITQTTIYREIYRRHVGDPDENPDEARVRYQSATSKVVKKMCDNGDLSYNEEKGYYIKVTSCDEREMKKWRGEIVRRVKVRDGYVQIAPNVMMMQIVTSGETTASIHEAQALFQHYVKCIDTSKLLFKIIALEDCLLFLFRMNSNADPGKDTGELAALVQDIVSVLGFPGVTVYD